MTEPTSTIPRLTSQTTLKRDVYQTLRSVILDGRLPPGHRLVEADLARDLGVSKTPVREALMLLEADGLVSMVPHQGARVAHMSLDELEELLFIKDALEFAALDRVYERITDDDLASARSHLEEMRRATDAEDVSTYRKALRGLHESLLAPCGFPRLVEMALDIDDRVDRVARFGLTTREDWWEAELRVNEKRLELTAARDPSLSDVVRAWHRDTIEMLRAAVEAGDANVQRLFGIGD